MHCLVRAAITLALSFTSLQSVAAEERVVVLDEHQIVVSTGTWRYRLVRFMDSSIETSHAAYPVFGMDVRNDTAEPLLCTGSGSFLLRSDGASETTIVKENSALLMPGAEVALLANSDVVVNIMSGHVQCASAKIAPLATEKSDCHLEPATGSVWPFPWQYPRAASRNLDSDVVTVEFLLPVLDPDNPGLHVRPAGAKVIDSRGIPSLDRAAIRNTEYLRLETNCPGALHRVRFEFRASTCPLCMPDSQVVVELQ